MKRLVFFAFLVGSIQLTVNAQEASYDINSVIDEIRLPNIYGQVIDISQNVESGLCLIFTNHQCAYANLYNERIGAISEKYKAQGIKVVAIESKIDSFEGSSSSLENFIQEESLPFEYLVDIDNNVSRSFGAESSPHAFLLQRQGDQLILVYAGSIDNNSRKPDKASQKYLTEAIESILNNQLIEKARTKAIGCTIDRGN